MMYGMLCRFAWDVGCLLGCDDQVVVVADNMRVMHNNNIQHVMMKNVVQNIFMYFNEN